MNKTTNGCVYENSRKDDLSIEAAEKNITMSAGRTSSVSANSGPSDGFHLKNPYLRLDKEDIMYHLALGNKSHDLVEMFGDVKFVCLGGTSNRMERFAYYIVKEIGYQIPPGTVLLDLSMHSHRYALFKVGPVISVSHGMGAPSISIVLHELIKLLYHAGVKDPIFLRLGTCGGIGVEPGSVVVTTEAVNGELKPVHIATILGKKKERPAMLNQQLAKEIIELGEPSDDFQIIAGKTFCADDFYEAQGRLDGAFCHYTEQDKLAFLNYLREQGVTNIEMESLVLAAITHHVGIKSAVICVPFLDRLKGDQIHQSKKTLENWQNRAMLVATRYIKKYLHEHPDVMERVDSKLMPKNSVAFLDCVDVSKMQNNQTGSVSRDLNDQSPKFASSPASSTSSAGPDYTCLPGCSIVTRIA